MNLKVCLFLLNIFFVCHLSYSQQEKPDSLVQVYLKEARQKIAEKKYESANNCFKKIFNLKTTLPDEVAYFYGITLLNLKSYVKAKAAFEKYIDLAGEKGEFYLESKKKTVEAATHICKVCNNTSIAEITDTCNICHGTGKVDEDCENCKSKGIEICTTCAGKGVFVSKTNFGSSYQTCKNCNGKGFVPCSVCQGSKKKSVYCSNCKGKGVFKRKTNCQHKF